jgi:hypothetical protein
MPFISFGDFPLAEALRPPLSVIDQDPVAVAAHRGDQNLRAPRSSGPAAQATDRSPGSACSPADRAEATMPPAEVAMSQR